MKRKLPAVIIFSFLALAGVFFAKDLFKGGRDMTEHTFETRTWCIGRFLVDLPVQFEMRFAENSFDRVKVTALGSGSRDDLKLIVQSRIAELQKKVEINGDEQEFVNDYTEDQMHIVVRKRVYYNPENDLGYFDEEAYFLSDGHMFMSEVSVSPKRVTSDHAALIRVSQAVRPRANDEIPTGVGACIEDAFVALPPTNESINTNFRAKDAEEFSLSLKFLHRVHSPKALPIKPYAKFPYERRAVAEYDGYEHYAVYFRQAVGETSYLHHKYIGGKSIPKGGDGLEIRVDLSKYMGEPNDPPYDEATSRTVWNGVLNSIRERAAK